MEILFVETALFMKTRAENLPDDEDFRELQNDLLANPEAGEPIPGTGGALKIRVRVAGRGKRGGARVIYGWFPARRRIYLFLVYPKSVSVDLSEAGKREMRALMGRFKKED